MRARWAVVVVIGAVWAAIAPMSGAGGAISLPAVRALHATAGSGPAVTLSWRWPGSASVTSAKIRFKAGGRPPRTSSSGDLAGIVTRDESSLTVYGLVPDSKYSFSVFSRGHGSTSLPASVTLHTIDGPTITSTSLPGGVVGTPYNTRLTVANATSGTWALEAGELPKGLFLNGSHIAGTPRKAGTTSFVVRYDDQHGDPTYAGTSIVVRTPPSPSPTPTSTPTPTAAATPTPTPTASVTPSPSETTSPSAAATATP